LAPPFPGSTASAAPTGKPPPPIATPVADIAFAAGSTGLSVADRAVLEKVAARYRQSPGRLRVVGYVGVGGGAADPLAAFRTALDHAQAVAAALAKTGIPAARIAVEAAPARRGESADHAEVLLEH
jgi:outer membrane protein OmpA-like peptidoglycan-associated protein